MVNGNNKITYNQELQLIELYALNKLCYIFRLLRSKKHLKNVDGNE